MLDTLNNLIQEIRTFQITYDTPNNIKDEQTKLIFEKCVNLFTNIGIIMANDLSVFPHNEYFPIIKSAIEIIVNLFYNFNNITIDKSISLEIQNISGDLLEAQQYINAAHMQYSIMISQEEKYIKYATYYQNSLLNIRKNIVKINTKLSGWEGT